MFTIEHVSLEFPGVVWNEMKKKLVANLDEAE